MRWREVNQRNTIRNDAHGAYFKCNRLLFKEIVSCI
jgi:hypothetical protein